MASAASTGEEVACAPSREEAVTPNGEEAAASVPTSQRIWLIRHAESINNVSKRTASEMWAAVRHGRLPAAAQLSAAAPMLLFPMDSPLSERGHQQVAQQRAVLDAAQFWQTNRVELVVQSPLRRATATCAGLGLLADGAECHTHPELYERTIFEHVVRSALKPRIERFVRWLTSRPERRIVVVGHSAFFRAMLSHEEHFGNCAVWAATLAADGTWSDVQLEHAGWDTYEPTDGDTDADATRAAGPRDAADPPAAAADPFELHARFVTMQRKDFAGALAEIRGGRKRSCWSWYVFPTAPYVVDGEELGSPINRRYALRDPPPRELEGDQAAAAYLAFESEEGRYLRANYVSMMTAVAEQLEGGTSALRLVGGADEAKLRASLWLFERVARLAGDGEVLAACESALAAMGASGRIRVSFVPGIGEVERQGALSNA